MTSDEIARRQLAVPFVPYSLFLTDGREILVSHPEVIAIEPEAATLFIEHSTRFGEVIDLRLIVSLKYKIGESFFE